MTKTLGTSERPVLAGANGQLFHGATQVEQVSRDNDDAR